MPVVPREDNVAVHPRRRHDARTSPHLRMVGFPERRIEQRRETRVRGRGSPSRRDNDDDDGRCAEGGWEEEEGRSYATTTTNTTTLVIVTTGAS